MGARVILEQADKNSDQASAQFVARLARVHGQDLLRFIAKRLRTSADAADIAQETYVRLLRLERKDLIRDPRPYLYRIAANVLYESELRRRATAFGLLKLAAGSESQADAVGAQSEAEVLEMRAHLERALQGLSPKCRAVILMHRRERMTYEEIAAGLGISTSMVKKYLAQGMQHCREHLQDIR